MKPVKPSSKYFTDRSKAVSFCGFFMVFFYLVFAMPLCASVYLAFWSPAVKGLTILLLFVVSNCEFVAFPLVSWIRCGTCLYRFLIFAPLLTLKPRIFILNECITKLIYKYFAHLIFWRDCCNESAFRKTGNRHHPLETPHLMGNKISAI